MKKYNLVMYPEVLVMSQYRKPRKNWLYRKGKDGKKIWIIYPEENEDEKGN